MEKEKLLSFLTRVKEDKDKLCIFYRNAATPCGIIELEIIWDGEKDIPKKSIEEIISSRFPSAWLLSGIEIYTRWDKRKWKWDQTGELFDLQNPDDPILELEVYMDLDQHICL